MIGINKAKKIIKENMIFKLKTDSVRLKGDIINV